MRIRKRTVVAAALAAVVLAGCGRDDDAPAPLAPADREESTVEAAALVGSWTHSFEEDAGASAIQWFRPSESRAFMDAWFRMRYEFHADGTCEWLWLSPIDAHEMRPGTWERDAKDPRLVRIYDEDGNLLEWVSFRLLGLDGALMRVVVLGEL